MSRIYGFIGFLNRIDRGFIKIYGFIMFLCGVQHACEHLCVNGPSMHHGWWRGWMAKQIRVHFKATRVTTPVCGLCAGSDGGYMTHDWPLRLSMRDHTCSSASTKQYVMPMYIWAFVDCMRFVDCVLAPNDLDGPCLIFMGTADGNKREMIQNDARIIPLQKSILWALPPVPLLSMLGSVLVAERWK